MALPDGRTPNDRPPPAHRHSVRRCVIAGALRHRLCVWRMLSDTEWVNGVVESGIRFPW